MSFGVNPKTGRPGPTPRLRDGDKKQARAAVNRRVQFGEWQHPNKLPCADCGHVWDEGEPRHEYDHHLGYAAEHHMDVEPVCSKCHKRRDSKKAAQTHCVRGHEFTKENTGRKTNGTRLCIECRKIYDKKRGRDAAFWQKYREKRNSRHG